MNVLMTRPHCYRCTVKLLIWDHLEVEVPAPKIHIFSGLIIRFHCTQLLGNICKILKSFWPKHSMFLFIDINPLLFTNGTNSSITNVLAMYYIICTAKSQDWRCCCWKKQIKLHQSYYRVIGVVSNIRPFILITI